MAHKIGLLLALAASLLGAISDQELKPIKNHASEINITRTR
ncbi:hypothetical protein [Flavobacterium wongokense]|nr:hypothetical protein [Flavobacterium sp. WG47]